MTSFTVASNNYPLKVYCNWKELENTKKSKPDKKISWKPSLC